MAVTLRRSASYSAGSIARSNFQTSGWEMGLNGMASASQSIHGHYGTNFDFSSSFSPSYEFSVFGSEKMAMQNLNSRLALYLEKVTSLETANLNLEQKINNFNESRTPASRDLSTYYSTIEDLQKQIIALAKQNQEVYTKLDNTGITASDFKMKYENELHMRMAVEADLTRLRSTFEENEMATKDLQIQMSWLKEELIFLKKSHEEDLHMARTQQNSSVNVEVDCAPAVDLNNKLEEIREQYETLILKNNKEIERWFQNKANDLKTDLLKSPTEITSSQTSFSELKKSYQTLEIEIKGIHTQIQMLKNNLVQVGTRHSERLSQLQLRIDRMQTELQQITANIQQQAMEYQQLLDIKMRLELEIAEYRSLLEGEEQGYHIDTSTVTSVSKSVTQTVVEETQKKQEKQEMEAEKHLRQRRVKIIIEEVVDGEVVATSTEEKVQDLLN